MAAKGWEVGPTAEEWIAFTEQKGIGDGLPIVVPTPERTEEFIATSGHPADDIIGRVPPSWGVTTVESLAINSVMAGARPEYFPVILAAFEAILRPVFGLMTIQVTTSPITPLTMVSGPVSAAIGMNSRQGYLGPGNRANATIGRAIRLALINCGGARPGVLDHATGGQPGKYSLAFAENDADSPWPSLARARGVEGNAITVIGIVSLVNHLDSTSATIDDLLTNLAQTLTLRGTNVLQMGGEVLLLLCPEHAATLACTGLSREEIAQELFRRARVPRATIPDSLARTMAWRRAGAVAADGAEVNALNGPGSVLLAVAGGPGKQSVVGFSMSSTAAQTVPVG